MLQNHQKVTFNLIFSANVKKWCNFVGSINDSGA